MMNGEAALDMCHMSDSDDGDSEGGAEGQDFEAQETAENAVECQPFQAPDGELISHALELAL